jgi:hypothetical protein
MSGLLGRGFGVVLGVLGRAEQEVVDAGDASAPHVLELVEQGADRPDGLDVAPRGRPVAW